MYATILFMELCVRIKCSFYIDIKETEYHSKFLTYYITFSLIIIF